MLTKLNFDGVAMRCLGIAALAGVLGCSSSSPTSLIPGLNPNPDMAAMNDASSDLDPSPARAFRRVFVTGQAYALSKLTSIDAVHAYCHLSAVNAHLQGNFKAWFSDGNPANEPAKTFDRSTVPYALIDNNPMDDPVIVADDWSSLTSSDSAVLRNPITRDEFGNEVDASDMGSDADAGSSAFDPGPTRVWTNTTASGHAKFKATCLGAAATDARPAAFGDFMQVDATWTLAAATERATTASDPTTSCSDAMVGRFYCFEQN
jgi:hypothetical protein